MPSSSSHRAHAPGPCRTGPWTAVEAARPSTARLVRIRPSAPPDHGFACDALAATPGRRRLAKRVQLVEGAMAALDHPCNDIVAPETDGPLELQEDLCRCEHRRSLPADHDED